jgi:hypothetical protein
MKNINQIIKNVLKEATGDSSGGRGSYIAPVQPGLRPWSGESLQPFTQSVSKYKSPLVQYDSYDKSWDLRLGQIKELEKTASKIQDFIKHNPYSTFSDDDGNIVNQFLANKKKPSFKEKMEPYTIKVPFNEWVDLSYDNIINEADTSITSGPYNAPLEIGEYKWENEMFPFVVPTENEKKNKNNLKNNIKRIVGVWEKDKNGSYFRDVDYPHSINEDLAVWFGKKKKPKGSSQPKGPWVDICRKVDGKHPPCGRKDTSKGSYPKCRAAGVAGKMSDSQKRSACQQKRRAEKKDIQTGKGQKPVMTSYKPKKKTNEDVKKIVKLTESDIRRIVMRVLKENIQLSTNATQLNKKPSLSDGLNLTCVQLNIKDPKNSLSTNIGPFPWSQVKYDKESRPVKLIIRRSEDLPSDGVFDDIILEFEEVTDPKLKGVLTDKKYVMKTYQTQEIQGKQYCRVNGDMDPEWDKNLFSFGNNASVIDPYPKID